MLNLIQRRSSGTIGNFFLAKKQIFAVYPNLEFLFLNGNQISQIFPNQFKPNPKLKVKIFTNCGVLNFFLQILDLSANKIDSATSYTAFKFLPDIKRLLFHHNLTENLTMTDLWRILKHQLPQLELLQCLTLRFNPKKFFSGQQASRDNFFSAANPNLISDVLARYQTYKTSRGLKFQNEIKAQQKLHRDLCPTLHKSTLPALKVKCYKSKRDALLLNKLLKSEADIEAHPKPLLQTINFSNQFLKKIAGNASDNVDGHG